MDLFSHGSGKYWVEGALSSLAPLVTSLLSIKLQPEKLINCSQPSLMGLVGAYKNVRLIKERMKKG
jgi:hypothetical protein